MDDCTLVYVFSLCKLLGPFTCLSSWTEGLESPFCSLTTAGRLDFGLGPPGGTHQGPAVWRRKFLDITKLQGKTEEIPEPWNHGLGWYKEGWKCHFTFYTSLHPFNCVNVLLITAMKSQDANGSLEVVDCFPFICLTMYFSEVLIE